MQTDKTSKHVLTTTELTCLMPIKPGFVDVLDTRTYATRLRIVTKVLNTLRVVSREVKVLKPIPDIVDAISGIHSFRFAILGDRLLLAVTFDRPWEPYMRIIWRDLGPLLDLILINCDGYEDHASDKGFDRFAAWVRQYQVEPEMFYAGSALSVEDVRYLTQLEQLQREGSPTFDLNAAKLLVKDPRKVAVDTGRANQPETIEQWLGALAALYGLRELYPGGDRPDEGYLHRATVALLPPLTTFDIKQLPDPVKKQFSQELEWFELPKPGTPGPPRDKPKDHEIQGGILGPYKKVTHGCLLLGRVVDPAKAREFLGRWIQSITTEGTNPGDCIYKNVAFTFGGLQRLGVADADLARFPKEFREGMAARAGLLGDLRSNHPDNWTLPEWNGNPRPNHDVARVRLSTVDFVIELRKFSAKFPEEVTSTDNTHEWSNQHPLYDAAVQVSNDAAREGVQVLSIQPLRHHRDKHQRVVDHFGFVDGISQPVVGGKPSKSKWDDRVSRGELLVGYENDRGDPPFPESARGSLLDNGTFLVVRKLKQDVNALRSFLKASAGVLAKDDLLANAEDDLLAKMMGRTLDGDPLADPGHPWRPTEREGHNDFDYETDKVGDGCPFHAHIRRGNPRTFLEPNPAQESQEGPKKSRVPRIARRGMSYGPRPTKEPDNEERGLVFLAYNASIAEQFEVIQRWMTGGNSTGVFSGQRDPFLGVPETGDPRTFRFLHHDEVKRVDLEQRQLVTLQWGMYLFVPSIAALKTITTGPTPDPTKSAAQVKEGETIIQRLKTEDDWRLILEDLSANRSGATAAVYAAIREEHGGALRTPYGVLVASEPLVMDVLGHDDVFSVEEYGRRMDASIGKIYLGMDSRDPEYRKQSQTPNAEIYNISEQDAFTTARECASNFLLDVTIKSQGKPVPVALEPFVDHVLAELSAYWFDIPDDVVIRKGGRPEIGSPTLYCPFHFLAPSRYIFSSPNPREIVKQIGQDHGTRVLDALTRFVAEHRTSSPAKLTGKLSTALFAAIGDDDRLARTLVGMLEGFVPTVYGNILRTLNLWLTDETLWRLQQDLLSCDAEPYQRACDKLKTPLKRAMQAQPVPDMVHRTVTSNYTLGNVPLQKGDRVVVAIVSATQDLPAKGQMDNVSLVFGGDRRATAHPTHACPGYAMGMGVLLGIISALLEAGTLRPTPANLVVKLEKVQAPTETSSPLEAGYALEGVQAERTAL